MKIINQNTEALKAVYGINIDATALFRLGSKLFNDTCQEDQQPTIHSLLKLINAIQSNIDLAKSEIHILSKESEVNDAI